MNSLIELFQKVFGKEEVSETRIAGSGSDRKYCRLTGDGKSVIGTTGEDRAENECFIRLAETFRRAGVSVPEVYAHTEDFYGYIQEDLGDESVFSQLGSPQADDLVKKALTELVKMQKVDESEWIGRCIAKKFDRRQAMWDLNYFKYEYLRPSGAVYDEDALEDDFEKLCERLVAIPEKFWGFMMRDCQSRNVMLKDNVPYFIDFQGGRKGPSLYDAVSFLWQARAGFPNLYRMRMLEYYCAHYCSGDSGMAIEMMSALPDTVLFRTLQVLGAYGFRGLVQKKAHFILSIPAALANLNDIVSRGWMDSYPELKRISKILVDDVRLKGVIPKDGNNILKVEIYSFSYKKGYPDNFTGNGGGFMFDCRAMHNPGRYPEYKKLTGRDLPVIKFLEECGEVQKFLSSAWSLTDPAVERYMKRGFSDLQIGFGCTGGQHRSVYCAEHTARHIAEIFPDAEVVLIHREISK